MYKDKDGQEMQYWWHHVVTLTAMISSLIAGYGISNIGCITLLCEVSTIFLNFRSAFSKETQNSCLATINQVIFFVTYTVFRMALQPYLLYKAVEDVIMFWQFRNGARNFFAIMTVLASIAMFLLMTYWYYLILRGVYKML